MEKNDQKILIYILGGTIGLLTGLAAAALLLKNQEESPENKALINSKDGLKIGFSLASILKQIAELGK
jgi:hypothetical protein